MKDRNGKGKRLNKSEWTKKEAMGGNKDTEGRTAEEEDRGKHSY